MSCLRGDRGYRGTNGRPGLRLHVVYVVLPLIGLITPACASNGSPDTVKEPYVAIDSGLLLRVRGRVVEEGSSSPLRAVGAWYVWPGEFGPETGMEAKCLAVSGADGMIEIPVFTMFDPRSGPPNIILVLLKAGYVPQFVRIRPEELKTQEVELGELSLKLAPEGNATAVE